MIFQSFIESEKKLICYLLSLRGSPIAIFEVVELEPDETGEGGAEQRVAVHRVLGDGGGVEVDVVDVPVEGPEAEPHVGAHLEGAGGPGGDGLEIADFSERVVVRQPVISSSLDVPCHEVSSELSLAFRRMFLE